MTTVYRKPTHTGRYTHFVSHHHPQVKSGTIWCLTKRARRICQDDSSNKELLHIKTHSWRMYTRIVSSQGISTRNQGNKKQHLMQKRLMKPPNDQAYSCSMYKDCPPLLEEACFGSYLDSKDLPDMHSRLWNDSQRGLAMHIWWDTTLWSNLI